MFTKFLNIFKRNNENWIKFENSKEWAKNLIEFLIVEIEKEKEKFIVQEEFSSIFVAWAPWAWKTEFVETILNDSNYIIIDIDNYRSYFLWYNWKNAKDYQDSCSRVATWILEYCLKNNLQFIFDGTLSSEMWKNNIKKVLRKNRVPNIILVYQDPMLSYFYTKVRQEKNERSVSQESFIRIYYNSIKYCFEIKKQFDCNFVVVSKNKERKTYRISEIENKEKFDKDYKISYNINALISNLNLVDNIFNDGKETK